MFRDISNITKVADFLPILNGAIITDLVVIFRLISGQIKSKTLKQWYNDYGLSGIIADVLSLVIGIIITIFLYKYLFSKFNIFLFAFLAVIVQLTHDLLFATLFYFIPRGKSRILDTFKDYGNEHGYVILIADALMILSTLFISSLLVSLSEKTNVIMFIVLLYLIPYFLYSI
jgi:uncharacterized protein YacL